MVAPFITVNDVKIGSSTPKGFTLEVNGYDPIECSYDMHFEKEPIRRNNRFTGKYKTICYPNYYVVVHWSDITKYKTKSEFQNIKEWNTCGVCWGLGECCKEPGTHSPCR